MVVDGHATPKKMFAPDGTVWLVQVAPELVVARMAPPELFDPTA
jgi:hypothetical protein